MGVARGSSSSDFTLSHVMLTPLKGGSFPSENLACEKKTDFCSKNWTGLGVSSCGTSGITATPTSEKSRMFLRMLKDCTGSA